MRAVCCVLLLPALLLLLPGEEPHSGIVASISSDNPALVTCVDDERLEFQVRQAAAGGGAQAQQGGGTPLPGGSKRQDTGGSGVR